MPEDLEGAIFLSVWTVQMFLLFGFSLSRELRVLESLAAAGLPWVALGLWALGVLLLVCDAPDPCFAPAVEFGFKAIMVVGAVIWLAGWVLIAALAARRISAVPTVIWSSYGAAVVSLFVWIGLVGFSQ